MRPVDSLQKQEGGRRPAPRRVARAIPPTRLIRLAREVEVRGFSSQGVVFGCYQFFARSGKTVFRPVVYDQFAERR